MWEWLASNAQNASPFVAVFCIGMLAIAGRVIVKMQDRNDYLNEQIIGLTRSSFEASNAIALALEKTGSTTALAIRELTLQVQNGGRKR